MFFVVYTLFAFCSVYVVANAWHSSVVRIVYNVGAQQDIGMNLRVQFV